MNEDGLGPTTYLIKSTSNAPKASFGMDTRTDIRSKNHVIPDKIDKPGPGTHDNKDVQFKKPAPKFGKDSRKGLEERQDFPAPNAYDQEILEVEANHHGFPLARRL